MSAHGSSVQGPRLGGLSIALCAAVLVSVLSVAGWDLSGGRLVTMSTPSMCPTVCVGSLVAIQPQVGPVHAGELVAFRPPGQLQVFTHRVVKVQADGSFTTKGDAEASPDPWIIAPAEVVGRVSFTVFGLGWWLRALPMVAVGTFLLLLSRRSFRLRSQRSFERIFGTMIVIVPLIVLHPLISGEVVETIADTHHHGWTSDLVVNTGLLPAQFHVVGGRSLSGLAPSRLHWLAGPVGRGGAVGVHQFAALPWWGWAITLVVVLSPLFGFLTYRLTTPVEIESEADSKAEGADILDVPQGAATPRVALSAAAGSVTVRPAGADVFERIAQAQDVHPHLR